LPARNKIPAKDSLIPYSVAQTQAFPRLFRHLAGVVPAVVLLLQAPAGAEPVAIRADPEVATAGF
jgi:hypothetical protein